MTNLVIDLSNIFFRSIWTVGGYGKKAYTFENEDQCHQLMRKVSVDVSSIIRLINPSRVIFAFDDKSWRKKIPIDENKGYKANREKSTFINWNNIYKIMDEFAEILLSNGFIVSKIPTAEADDIILLWRDELLFNQNQHVIIVSADEDVRQLVKGNNKSFSVVYNPFMMGKNAHKRLFVPTEFENWLDDEDIGDIFNRNIDIDKEDFKRLKNTGTVIESIDGNLIAMRKVFCGDDGDNVPSIYTWLNEKDKEVRITNSKFENIIEYAKIKNIQDIMDKREIIKEQLFNISKKPFTFKIEDRIQRQLQLVVLDKKMFPEEIVKTFEKEVKENLNKSKISSQNWNMNSILEGTKYITPGKYVKNTSNEASIFKEIENLNLNKQLF